MLQRLNVPIVRLILKNWKSLLHIWKMGINKKCSLVTSARQCFSIMVASGKIFFLLQCTILDHKKGNLDFTMWVIGVPILKAHRNNFAKFIFSGPTFVLDRKMGKMRLPFQNLSAPFVKRMNCILSSSSNVISDKLTIIVMFVLNLVTVKKNWVR